MVAKALTAHEKQISKDEAVYHHALRLNASCVFWCTYFVLHEYAQQPNPVFLSHFWVSKLHPKILQWHPKFWKPRYGFALYGSKTIWRKHAFLHVATASDGYNIIGWHNFLAQMVEAKIASMVSVRCHAQRLASACYFPAADLYSRCLKLRKHFNATVKVLYCFTVAISLPGAASDLQWRQKVGSCSAHGKQGGCRVFVRFWLLGLRWSSCQKTKTMQCALLCCDFWKQKISTWCFGLVNIATSPDRTEESFSKGMSSLCTYESFRKSMHQ